MDIKDCCLIQWVHCSIFAGDDIHQCTTKFIATLNNTKENDSFSFKFINISKPYYLSLQIYCSMKKNINLQVLDFKAKEHFFFQ